MYVYIYIYPYIMCIYIYIYVYTHMLLIQTMLFMHGLYFGDPSLRYQKQQ